MDRVRRVYVEKKDSFAVAAHSLAREIRSYLGVEHLETVRVLIRYDIENVSEPVYQQACRMVFSEPPVDLLYEESFPVSDRERAFAVEYLPGQFDQRADSAQQCVKLLNEEEDPVIRSATVYVISGEITDAEFAAIKEYCINPVDSRETGFEKPKTLLTDYEEPHDIAVFDGFITMDETQLEELYNSLNLAMTFRDFEHIRNYFAGEEHRDPTVTEIRVLDTYWSDHCRHTTFSTEIRNVEFEDGFYRKPIEEAYERYLKDRTELSREESGKVSSLMDLAQIALARLKKEGKVQDQEQSDEINACSIVVPVTVTGDDGEERTEDWLINFKNETHNHPTEIEPFGGAATCLGGAIRDPLAGRTYVYQAMRVTGAADPTVPVSDTMKGKLPQKKLVREAAHGYSSYGNQIGLATGYVKEIYHPSYAAKRMEIGAVIGAAPKSSVVRESCEPGDWILLLGGRTGRDGIGGATGSSKVHTETSIETCGAEVQKGNAPTERKLQRLFKRPEASRLIKKCNDFGAGGVAVAIGELADGIHIDLDLVPKKYAGLDGTEIAISESQERMAVVVDPKNAEEFMRYAAEENLEATKVAAVTEIPRLVMFWRGRKIVDLSRDFLNTNGAHQETDIFVELPSRDNPYFTRKEVPDVREKWLSTLSGLNCCSQKGLVEMFDSSIGAGSVLMPYGGRYQMTETQVMVGKLPLERGSSDTVTMMSYGFDPYLSEWSPYHGAVYAVIESVAKIVAGGGDPEKIRFTFQEYFRRMTEDPKRWSEPFTALLGAYDAQIGLGLPSLGGKDSMSGSFNEMDVPPTLVSFAVDTADDKTIITPELKHPGSQLILVQIDRNSYDLPDYEQAMDQYRKFYRDVKDGNFISAYALDGNGLAAALSKMAFGNGYGFRIDHSVDERDLFTAGFGDLIAEVPDGALGRLSVTYTRIGEVTDDGMLSYRSVSIPLKEAFKAWTGTLSEVFPTESGTSAVGTQTDKGELYQTENVYVCRHRVAKPRVFIPVFAGTNCEYDSKRAFEKAGAEVDVRVFRNRNAQDIRDSVDAFERSISRAQILFFPGGFSAGDEPDGSAKFVAAAFQSERIREAVLKLLNERDGLALGICNGFQALIKLGLLPGGEITGQREDSPTLTFNTIGRHISKMVCTKVVSNKSPWLSGAKLGGVYTNPASHGEGRFVADSEWLSRLFANGQVATRYCDPDGNIDAGDERWNVNGSYAAIEGITSPDGRVFGKMAHAERRGKGVAINIYGEQNLNLFESGTAYFMT